MTKEDAIEFIIQDKKYHWEEFKQFPVSQIIERLHMKGGRYTLGLRKECLEHWSIAWRDYRYDAGSFNDGVQVWLHAPVFDRKPDFVLSWDEIITSSKYGIARQLVLF
jgi:hypothetical protein